MKKILLILYFINFINIKNQYSHDEEINNTINNNTDKNILTNKLNSNLPSTIDNKNPEMNIPKEPDNKSPNIIKKKINQQDNNNDNKNILTNKLNSNLPSTIDNKNPEMNIPKKPDNKSPNIIKKKINNKDNNNNNNKKISNILFVPLLKKKLIKKDLKQNKLIKKDYINIIILPVSILVMIILIIFFNNQYQSKKLLEKQKFFFNFLNQNISKNYFSNNRYEIIEKNNNPSKFQYVTEEDLEKIKISNKFVEYKSNIIKNAINNIKNTQDEKSNIIINECIKNNKNITNSSLFNFHEKTWFSFISPLKEKIKDMKLVPIISFNEKDEIIINFDTSNTLITTQDIEKLITKFQLNSYEQKELRKLPEQQFIHSLITKDILIQRILQTIKIIEGYFSIAQNVIDLNKKRHKLKKNRKHFIKIENIPAYIEFDIINYNEIELVYYDVYDEKFIFKIEINITLNFQTNKIDTIGIHKYFSKQNNTITIEDNNCFFDYNENFILKIIDLGQGGLIIDRDKITKK